MREIRYAEAGGQHLAFRVLDGADGHELVLITPGGTIPMQMLESDRIGARLIDGLRAIGRLVLFDRRGIGLSDPISDWTRPLVEQWAEDLATIIEAATLGAPVVVSLGDYWGPARLFAGQRADALSALVVYEPNGPQEPLDFLALVAETEASRASSARDDWIARVCPSRKADRDFREWFDLAGSAGASPGVAARLYDRPSAQCVDALITAQQRIAVPTLILRRPANRVGSPRRPDPVAVAIDGSRSVDLPGSDYHWLGEDVDAILMEISRFVVGESRLPPPDRFLSALMFTDIVGSTDRASSIGDAQWTSVLNRHDDLIRDEVGHLGGSVVKSTGDGVLALLPSADHALRAASTIRDQLEREGLEIRIGIHVGDVERRGSDIAGLGVHVASRVSALATSGEILVTASVPIATLGAGHVFDPRGRQSLKGVPGDWYLYALA